jgi:hypothetical protein
VTVAFHPTLLYRKSSRCTTGGCVEVAPLPDGGAVVRDTKDHNREPLTFDRQEWIDFVSGVKNGEFDFDATQRVEVIVLTPATAEGEDARKVIGETD